MGANDPGRVGPSETLELPASAMEAVLRRAHGREHRAREAELLDLPGDALDPLGPLEWPGDLPGDALDPLDLPGDALEALDAGSADPRSLPPTDASGHHRAPPVTPPLLADTSRPRPGQLLGPIPYGTIIDKRYKIRDVLGVGGTAVVYRVFDGRKGVERALKILDVRSAVPDVLERFWQEIRVSASLEHPNIVAVHGYGEWQGKPYLVMELLDGRSLAELMAERQSRPLPIPIVLDLMEQAARGLAAAHALGVTHRDLKPGNLFVSTRLKHLVVTDFGLARAVGLAASITATGIVVGTPSYTPPERLRDSKSATAKGDLYSLGVVMYEAMTGERLFRATTLPEIVHLVDTWHPPRPSRFNAAIPTALDEYVLNLLEKNPEHRVGSAAMLADALAELGRVTQGALTPA